MLRPVRKFVSFRLFRPPPQLQIRGGGGSCMLRVDSREWAGKVKSLFKKNIVVGTGSGDYIFKHTCAYDILAIKR